MAKLSIKIFIRLTICTLLFGENPGFAFEEGSFIKNLVIRQRTYQTNGIRVCQPVPLDEKILSIIINNRIRSFEDYTHWLCKNIKYIKDGERDHWLTPEEMLQKKAGDCEDYAFLNAAVLRVLGYQPQVLVIGGFGFHHAICVFEENGHYSWMDNSEFRRTKTRSILEFARYLFSEYGGSYLLKINPKNRDWDILFRKSKLLSQK